MSIICDVDQLDLVYHTLRTSAYSVLDPCPYVMDCSLEGYTLSDKRASDKWGLHHKINDLIKEGVPISTPFAMIVTGRQQTGHKPHNDRTAHTLHNLRDATNPAPAFCKRDKYHFSINMSRDWQEAPDAPMCQEFPYSYAYANFLWWHTRPEDLVVIVNEDVLLPLVASYMSVNLLVLTNMKAKADQLDKGLKSLQVLKAEEQKRLTAPHFSLFLCLYLSYKHSHLNNTHTYSGSGICTLLQSSSIP